MNPEPVSRIASSGRRRPRLVCRLPAGVALVVFLAGCGGGDVRGTVTEDSLKALETGRQELAAKNLEAARDSFAAAAQAGGLQVDLYCEARLQQAYCAACLGEHEAAHALLDELTSGAPDLGRVHAMRGFVFARQGMADKAEAEIRKARALSPGIALPTQP